MKVNLSTVAVLTLIITLPMLGACTMNSDIEADALLTQTSPEIQQELTAVITGMLNGKPAILAQNAFVSESRILIERKMHLDAEGFPLQGRSLEMPEAFVLIKRGSLCLLKHETTEQYVTLTQAQCRIEN